MDSVYIELRLVIIFISAINTASFFHWNNLHMVKFPSIIYLIILLLSWFELTDMLLRQQILQMLLRTKKSRIKANGHQFNPAKTLIHVWRSSPGKQRRHGPAEGRRNKNFIKCSMSPCPCGSRRVLLPNHA